MAARTTLIQLRVDEHEDQFIKQMAKGSHLPKAVLVYAAIREYIEAHGFEHPEDRPDDKDGETLFQK